MDSDEEQYKGSNHIHNTADSPSLACDARNNNVLHVPYSRKERHSHGGGYPNHSSPVTSRLHRRRSSVAFRAALAVENAARRMSVPAFSIDRIEEDLDKEIAAEEKQKESTNVIQILRRSCRDILHSKKVLLMIVVLNIFDCALVLAGLILDIHYIKEMVKDAKLMTKKFTSSMSHAFPSCFYHFDVYHLHEFYNIILSGLHHCNDSQFSKNRTSDVTNEVGYASVHHRHSGFTLEDLPSFLTKHHNGHEWEIKIGLIFHKASIAILAVLVFIVLLKVVSYGCDIFKRKLELFDGLIVVASFILDVVYLKGFTVYPIEDIVQILAFLMPWRVIRVANSLVMAVMDQAHLQLKMVYNEKKSCEEKLTDIEEENKLAQRVISALKKLCDAEGIATVKVATCINSCGTANKRKRKLKRSLKKKLKKATCLSVNEERQSLPYGHVETLQQDTLSHLRRIASSANHMSTFEEVEEEDDKEEDDDIEENNPEEAAENTNFV